MREFDVTLTQVKVKQNEVKDDLNSFPSNISSKDPARDWNRTQNP